MSIPVLHPKILKISKKFRHLREWLFLPISAYSLRILVIRRFLRTGRPILVVIRVKNYWASRYNFMRISINSFKSSNFCVFRLSILENWSWRLAPCWWPIRDTARLSTIIFNLGYSIKLHGLLDHLVVGNGIYKNNFKFFAYDLWFPGEPRLNTTWFWLIYEKPKCILGSFCEGPANPPILPSNRAKQLT